tara:strand:- start:128025 stop:129281 length:1257 start_codon:yes stop_codon:yes gene_type:complete
VSKNIDRKNVNNYPRVFISTGASGGHIFPGLAIADALRKKGVLCTFIGSGRQFTATVKEQGFDFINLPASQVNVPGLQRKLYALKDLAHAFVVAFKIIRKEKPVAVLGLGSYASVAAVLAARVQGIPTILHEQNAKPGRANLMLAPIVKRVLLAFDAARTNFKDSAKKPKKYHAVGNPVRKDVLELRGVDRTEDGKLHVLVFGGSQGSRILSDIVPAAIAELPLDLQKQLEVTQQARPEDVENVKRAYAETPIQPTVSPFFDNLPELMHQAHVVIGRSGTGSISELAILNRASILVPLRLADGHQIDNAQILTKAGAAVMIEEQNLNPDILARELKELLTRQTKRELFESNAALVAKPQAATDAADEIMKLAGLGHVESALETQEVMADAETGEPLAAPKPKAKTAMDIANEKLGDDI